MTKDAYFEMCDMLGTEPLDEDIPVELDDFPDLIQRTLLVYSYLPDIWEGMSGTFMGKDISLLFQLFELFYISREEHNISLDIVGTIDAIRKKIYKDKKPVTKPSTPKA